MALIKLRLKVHFDEQLGKQNFKFEESIFELEKIAKCGKNLKQIYQGLRIEQNI